MEKAPLIALVLGSDSDLPQVEPALEILREFAVPHTVRILSAHRTPDQAVAFARSARADGLRVLVAVAGAAAHLGGVLAAHTDLPVIGVPMAATPLGGLDALLSTVQMPAGVPVASMAIGPAGVRNALLFAVRILALADEALAGRLAQAIQAQSEKVRGRDEACRSRLTWGGGD